MTSAARVTIEVLRRSLARFADMGGVDRAMGLAAQGFTALFPLVIVVAAVISGGDGGSVGDSIVRRFGLSGAAADAAHSAFPPSGEVGQSVTVFSVLLLTVSALSFARSLQRLYEHAWNLEARGWRDTPYGVAWLGGVCVYLGLHPLLHDALPHRVGL